MLDASGCILYQTVNAERLFSLLDGTNDERAPNPGRCWPILDTIRALVRSLVEASKGRATKPRPIVRRTHWGQVIVEASWLAPTSTEAGQFDPLATPIAVHVELCEHAAACAARALRASGATPAQVRVGVLLALGKSKPEIARTLGIKESSVQDAARKLYSKLDVRNATELGVLLWLKTDKDGMAGKA